MRKWKEWYVSGLTTSSSWVDRRLLWLLQLPLDVSAVRAGRDLWRSAGSTGFNVGLEVHWLLEQRLVPDELKYSGDIIASLHQHMSRLRSDFISAAQLDVARAFVEEREPFNAVEQPEDELSATSHVAGVVVRRWQELHPDWAAAKRYQYGKGLKKLVLTGRLQRDAIKNMDVDIQINENSVLFEFSTDVPFYGYIHQYGTKFGSASGAPSSMFLRQPYVYSISGRIYPRRHTLRNFLIAGVQAKNPGKYALWWPNIQAGHPIAWARAHKVTIPRRPFFGVDHTTLEYIFDTAFENWMVETFGATRTALRNAYYKFLHAQPAVEVVTPPRVRKPRKEKKQQEARAKPVEERQTEHPSPQRRRKRRGLFGTPRGKKLFGKPYGKKTFGRKRSKKTFGKPYGKKTFGKRVSKRPVFGMPSETRKRTTRSPRSKQSTMSSRRRKGK